MQTHNESKGCSERVPISTQEFSVRKRPHYCKQTLDARKHMHPRNPKHGATYLPRWPFNTEISAGCCCSSCCSFAGLLRLCAGNGG